MHLVNKVNCFIIRIFQACSLQAICYIKGTEIINLGFFRLFTAQQGNKKQNVNNEAAEGYYHLLLSKTKILI